MKITGIILFLLSISTIFTTNASTPFNWCMTELRIVQEKILTVDSDAIEIVDGYNDMDSIKDLNKCESLLSEAEGNLEQVCKDFYKTNKLPGLNDLMKQLSKGVKEACKEFGPQDNTFQGGGPRSVIQEPQISDQLDGVLEVSNPNSDTQ